jgi:hypothetical protein
LTKEVVFFCAGLVAGLVTAAVGPKWPTIFTVGVGPAFFTALVVAIAMTDSWPRLSRGIWRYAVAAVISTLGYILALVTFSGLGGYSPELFGVHRSNDISDFHADVWIGLLAASLVAAIFTEFVAYVLTNRWSNGVLACLAGAGALSVVVTFTGMRLVKLTLTTMPMLYHCILFSVGEALFCALIGAQILRSSRPTSGHLQL